MEGRQGGLSSGFVSRQEAGVERGARQGGLSSGFVSRQEAHLLRSGRFSATAASRVKEAVAEFDSEGGGEGGGEEAAESVSRASFFSHTPSLHPSVAGSAMSDACSRETIGAGDATRYWDFQHRAVVRGDLGHKCRECRRPFGTIGEPLTERRGARLSLRYHAECFSGFADPRSQLGSSHHTGPLAGHQMVAAPSDKASTKMRTGSHFCGDGAPRGSQMVNASGKAGHGLGMGVNSCGNKSSRYRPHQASERKGEGDLSEAQLNAHNAATMHG
ncbi:hypothetical protein AB1Y20_016731 [Prymnesium parvum]|uniref:LIM zinc-binding domain-containing protein n=1 Tax=Prymnesium parvum TaxID=97485 RepID=A0AB34IAG6_PRYPA